MNYTHFKTSLKGHTFQVFQPDQIYILCPSLKINGQLPAPTVNSRGDSFSKWHDFQLSMARDLDLGSSHTAYHRASLIDLYLHAKFQWNQRNFLWTDKWTFETDFRLRRVDLTRWLVVQSIHQPHHAETAAAMAIINLTTNTTYSSLGQIVSREPKGMTLSGTYDGQISCFIPPTVSKYLRKFKAMTPARQTHPLHLNLFLFTNSFQSRQKYKTSTSVFGDGRISTRANPTSTHHTIFYKRHISSEKLRRRMSTLMFTSGWPIRPILGFWGSKVPQNQRFPNQDADKPPCKIWRL